MRRRRVAAAPLAAALSAPAREAAAAPRGGGAVIPTAGPAPGFAFSGGAGLFSCRGGPAPPCERLASGEWPQDIRSGGPGGDSQVTFGHVVEGAGRNLSRVSLRFRYVTGYGCEPGCDGAPVVALVAVDAETGADAAMLYTSPPLNGYAYNDFKGYSPPVVIDAAVRLPDSRPVRLALRFHNGKRNLQLFRDPDRGFDLRVYWAGDGGASSGFFGGGCGGGCMFVAAVVGAGVVYLAAGVAYNRRVRQLRGAESIPHVAFWRDVPHLVRDGAAFVAARARGRGGYAAAAPAPASSPSPFGRPLAPAAGCASTTGYRYGL